MESSVDGGSGKGSWDDVIEDVRNHETMKHTSEDGKGGGGIDQPSPPGAAAEARLAMRREGGEGNVVDEGGMAVRPDHGEGNNMNLNLDLNGEEKQREGGGEMDDEDEEDIDEKESEMAELALFHVRECYVYKIPPRKSNLSYRADEWDINKWTWQGALRIVSKGTACSIRLEDPTTGELFAQAPVRSNEPLPVEGVVDSSRFFVIRVEDASGSHVRHAFVGLGFRERTQAYDFNAALQDHLKYVNRKKEADLVAEEYKNKPSADYSLKEGQTLRLEIRTCTSPTTGSDLKMIMTKQSPFSIIRSGDGGSGGTLLMKSWNRSGAAALFTDQRGVDGNSTSVEGGGGSSIGISLSPRAIVTSGDALRRPSLDSEVSGGGGGSNGENSLSSKIVTASSNHPPSVPAVPSIIPPPPPPLGFALFPSTAAAVSVSLSSELPAVPNSSDIGPEDDDFGDFQVAK